MNPGTSPPIPPASATPPPPIPPPLPPPGGAQAAAGKKLSPWLLLALIVGGLLVLAIPILAVVAGMTLPALAKAKDKAQRIQCVNNLKMLGLAARVFATDHEDQYPKGWNELKEEIGSPRILHCPADTVHTSVPTTFEQALSESSYVYEGVGASETNLTRVIVLCPYHHNVLLADGSVQQLPKGGGPTIEIRDGHKYLR